MNKTYRDLIYRFQNQGIGESQPTGIVLIGKASHIALEAWLNALYPPLSKNDAQALEKELGMEIPIDYKKFLPDVSNGLDILVGTSCLNGLGGNYRRSTDESHQPFSIITINVRERPRNAADNHFFIGGYDWDGFHLYIDKRTSTVHYCNRDNVTSLFQWETFKQMLISELKRAHPPLDERGRKIDEGLYTTPIKG